MITKINLALFFVFFSLSMSAQVTGVVYRDFNGNGSRQTSAPNNEPGVAGVVINAYNPSNSLVQSATSAGDGSYSITASLPLRLEYVIPAGLNCVNSLLDYNGFSGDGNNVRLVTTASTQNFAVNFVDQYTTNTNPKVYVPMYVMGNPLGSGTASTQAAFWSYDYNSSTTPANSVSLAQSQLGTVWGVAYSKQAKKVFTSAFIKRHSGLGSLGSGGIYMLDGTTLSKTNFYDLDANGIRTRAASGAVAYGAGTSFTIAGGTTITYLGPTDAVSGFPEGLGVIGDNSTHRLLPDNMNADAYDPAAFDQVGKAGLGDLDISDDGKFLFVMNLYSRSVVRLELDNAYNPTSVVSATSYPIPNYAVTNGVLRPFAVQYYRGKVYIGTVASGENAGTLSDLFAHVFELNDPVGSATFNTTPILSIPLNYKKGYPMQPMNSDVYKYWKPWSNNSANVHDLGEQAWSTPILSNLEFTDRGDMILDFMDRGGHQYGYNTYLNLNSTASGTAMYDVSGDVLIAGRDCNTGGWTLESNGSYNSDGTAYTSAGAGNTEGPGGGEFYYLEIPPDNYHHETSQGAAAIVHGTETGIFTLMDANAAFSGGTAQFNNYTANATNRLTLYGSADGFLSKANGLGDIEVAGDEPPIEVGNLVWNDANYDGIQTAGEVGISGVTVELFCDFDNNDIPDGAAIGSTTTDGNGYWYFNNANVIDGDCGVAGNQTGLQLNKKYLVRIGSSDWTAGVGAGDLTGMLLAASNSPTTGLSDASDNDASLISSIPTIGFTTTNKLGENNHSYDFGFHFPPPCTVTASVVSGSQSICSGEDPVAFTETTPASGNGTLSYQWQSSTTNCSSGFTDILGANGTTYDPPANLTITTYYHVVVTNDDGFTTCTATSNCITVTVNSLPTADAGSTQNLDCTTTSATIGTSAIGGNTYSWSPATGLSSTTIAQPTASPISTTVYTVTVTGSNGCTATSTVTVNVNTTVPTADAGSTQNLDCTTTSATIGTTSIGGNTYSWSPATGLSSTTIAQPTASPSSTTVYTVTVTGSNGCTATSTVTVNVNTTAPTADAGSTQNLDCTTTSAIIGTSAIGGNTYSWSPATGLSSTTIAQPTASPSSTTVYTVTVTGSNGCTATSTVTVNVNTTAPTADAGSTQNLDCITTSATIGTSAIGGNTYSWSPATGLSSTTIAQPNASPTSTTVYTVTVTGSNGCTATSTVTVNVNTTAPIADAGSTQNLDCTTTSATIGTSAIGGNTYSWSPATGLSSTTIAQPTASPSSTTVYTVTVTGSNGCTATSTVTVNVNTTAPTADAGSTQNIDCTTTSATIGTSAIGGNTYSWSPATGLSSTTIAQPTASPSSTTVYTVTVTGSNGCTATSTVTVNVNTTTPTADAGSTQNLDCTTTSATIGTSAIGGNTYSWSQATGLSSTTIAQPTASPSSTTVYTVTVTGSNGCTATSTVTVDVNTTTPTVVISGSTAVCNGSTTTLTASGASTYVWSNTDITPSTTVGVGTYTVTGTASNGCTATSTVDVINQQGSIGNYVWEDLNKNGLNDELAMNGINGVAVELWKETAPASGIYAFYASTTTANDGGSNPGYYNFPICENANYQIHFPSTIGLLKLTNENTTPNTDNNSDANPISGLSPVIAIDVTGVGVSKDNMTIDAGYYSKAQLGNYVWNDLDHDGEQDVNEVGVAGIAVTLYNQSNEVVSTTLTDAYGYYKFNPLDPGQYYVGFSLPANYEFTLQNTVGDLVDNDVNPITGLTGNYTLLSGDSNMSVDAGIYFVAPTTATVGNFVWYDTDKDGVQDAGEQGISGVVVTLYNSLNQVVASMLTDANGFYLFTDVTPGTYTVGFTLKPGLVFSPNNNTIDNPSNSDANLVTGITSSFIVLAGDNITYVDAGMYNVNLDFPLLGGLGDRVWYDADQDGVQDEGETGVQGVLVTLYQSDGTTVISTTTTNAFGYYVFNALPAGQYVVGFSDLPLNYTLTTNTALDSVTNSDANPGTGKTNVINLGNGQYNMTYDAGIYNTLPANTNSIGDYVWNDVNKNGIQEPSEIGVSGVTVTLYNASNVPISSTSTDASGYYHFPDLPNGTFYVGFSNLPTGYVFSPQGNGTASTDSDPNPANGLTTSVTLVGNTHITDLDAGINIGNTKIGLGSLGDLVWYDLNNNGLQDANELGVQGVTVTLYESDGTTVISTTTTNALGYYIFTSLEAGSYVVGFSNLPSGFVISPKDADAEGLNGELNSDVNSLTQKTDLILLGTGEDKMSVDMGIVPPTGTASLGNLVWFDLNNDGLQTSGEPGVQGVTVSLYNAINEVVSTTTTNAQGEYYFVGLVPATYSVGFSNLPEGYTMALYNSDLTGINGALNSDADPVSGLTTTVTLSVGENNPNLDAGIVSTIVASVGDYVWFDADHDGLQDPSEQGVGGVLVTLYDNTNTPVASTITDVNGGYIFTNVTPGSYTIGFSNIPVGMEFTQEVGGPSDNDNSNVNPSTGLTASFTVVAGTHNPTIDAGLTTPQLCGLGNYVWIDTDKDGLQDPTESGVAGVLVRLYASELTTILATTTTDGSGQYSFTSLPAGTYAVGFSNLPNGYTRTLIVGSINDASNSDMNADGKTNAVTLVGGEYNPNLDAGIYFGFPLPALELKATVAIIKENNLCDVNWFTREEQNTSRFEIERSVDGVNFEKVGSHLASGNTTGLTNYDFSDNIDAVSKQHILYYRIKLIDVDGKFSYSNTISVKPNENQEQGVSVYPVPFMNELWISYQSLEEADVVVELADLSGRVLTQKSMQISKGSNQIQLSELQSLAAANYVVRIKNLTSGDVYIRKVLK